VFKTTFNNISVISWRSVLLLKVALKTMPPSNSPLLIIGIRIDDSIAIKYENP
jgi:hypothetical protein